MLSVVPLLFLVVVPGVQLFLSSNLSTISTDRTILRFAQCYMTVFVSIQVIIVVFAWAFYFLKSENISGISGEEVTISASIIFVVGVLLVWIQAVKLLQTFYTPTHQTAINPPWFLQRPILYSGFFLPELLCVIIYAVTSIQLRFLKPVRDGKMGHHRNETEAAASEEGTTTREGSLNVHEKIEIV